ncbi:response regulator [Pseudanabaenaceae cyanobacterium LEGE 13415]|nr:response regulator [Pseudanabaenaceae cyanobacterium LEGE 13415]
MTLRQRTLLTIGIAVVALNAVLYTIASTLLLKNVQQAEEQDTRKQLNGVISVVNQSLEQFNRNFSDWAIWDDAYAFVQNGDPRFIQSNLIEGQLATNQINLIAFIQPAGQITFGTGFDLKIQQKTPIPPELQRHLVPNDRLLQHPHLTHTISGIISLPEGNMMIISRPILTSDGKGPVQGTLVVGRYLDQSEVDRLANITRLKLDIEPITTAQLPAHLEAWRRNEKTDYPAIGMQALNSNTIVGYALFQDIYGKPAIVLRTDSDRTIFQQGQTTLRFLAGSMLGTGVIFCIVTLLLLERLVLSRLAKLSSEVNAISRDNLSSRVSELGQDELSKLSVGINTMLADLEAYEQNRHSAVSALESSERKFRNLFENSQIGIFRVRMTDSMILDANQQFIAMTGYTSTTVIGQKRTTDFYLHPEDRDTARQRLVQSGELRNFETQFRRQDGSTFWGLFSARFDRESDCVDGVLADISDRRQAEEALRHSEATKRAIIDAIPDLLLRVQRDGAYLEILTSKHFKVCSIEKLIVGSTVFESLPPELADRRMNYIQQALKTRELQIYEQQIVIDAQLRDEEVRIVPSLNNEVLIIVRDITDRKAVEAAMRRSVEAAEAANRAKSMFLSNMSHELRTPLNVILGFSQLLLRGGSLTTQQKEYLDTINRGGEHLLTLINDVLEMSKIEAGRVTLTSIDVDLHKLLHWVQQMFQMKAQSKGLQLLLQIAPDVPRFIHTDESKLRQVLVNLVGNAVKFTERGAIALRAKLSDTLLQFEVEDTGAGIAPDDLSRLFQPFVQTESGQKAHEGTGLGLAISQKFVNLMGGEITVSSTVGMGTLFRFSIQLSIANSTPQSTTISRQTVVDLAPDQPIYRILIVEDKAENRQVLRELLTSVGFEVQEAVNGLEAIELWERWQPHLIWMDIRMPVMDGYEATQRIRAASNRKNLPIIIAVTGSVFEEDRKIAIAMGCNDFVRKPFQVEIIFEKMAESLGVRYQYADTELNEITPLTALTSTDLNIMPAKWRHELHQAASRANTKQLLHLIEQVPTNQVHLVTSLTQLVNDFCFEEIVQLLSL